MVQQLLSASAVQTIMQRKWNRSSYLLDLLRHKNYKRISNNSMIRWKYEYEYYTYVPAVSVSTHLFKTSSFRSFYNASNSNSNDDDDDDVRRVANSSGSWNWSWSWSKTKEKKSSNSSSYRSTMNGIELLKADHAKYIVMRENTLNYVNHLELELIQHIQELFHLNVNVNGVDNNNCNNNTNNNMSQLDDGDDEPFKVAAQILSQAKEKDSIEFDHNLFSKVCKINVKLIKTLAKMHHFRVRLKRFGYNSIDDEISELKQIYDELPHEISTLETYNNIQKVRSRAFRDHLKSRLEHAYRALSNSSPKEVRISLFFLEK